MKVKAIRMGMYQNRIRERGDVFDIEDRLFSPRWMMKVGEPVVESKERRQNLDDREAIEDQLKADKLYSEGK